MLWASELWVLGDDSYHVYGGNRVFVSWVVFFNELTKSTSQVTFAAQDIVRVQVCQVIIPRKVFDQFGYVQYALDCRIKITSVS